MTGLQWRKIKFAYVRQLIDYMAKFLGMEIKFFDREQPGLPAKILDSRAANLATRIFLVYV